MNKRLYLALLFVFSLNANATVMSFTGNFASDDSRFYLMFDVTAVSTVELTSYGYAGGTNAAGTVIPDGGFDTQLFLYDSGGNQVFVSDDDSLVDSASSGNAWDALISRILAVDSYLAVLTQYDNDYVSGDLLTGDWSGAGTTNFLDFDGFQRTSAYALDISGDFITNLTTVSTDTVPEPAGLALFGLGLAGIGWLRYKRYKGVRAH